MVQYERENTEGLGIETSHARSECQLGREVSRGEPVTAGMSSSTFFPISDAVWVDNHGLNKKSFRYMKGKVYLQKGLDLHLYTLRGGGLRF
jgi:hypothetical protein